MACTFKELFQSRHAYILMNNDSNKEEVQIGEKTEFKKQYIHNESHA